jgi:hypothetical protein
MPQSISFPLPLHQNFSMAVFCDQKAEVLTVCGTWTPAWRWRLCSPRQQMECGWGRVGKFWRLSLDQQVWKIREQNSGCGCEAVKHVAAREDRTHTMLLPARRSVYHWTSKPTVPRSASLNTFRCRRSWVNNGLRDRSSKPSPHLPLHFGLSRSISYRIRLIEVRFEN